ncbi:NAD(P)H-hydrate epimerase / ADP-dependent (S)-NAD(P)H-hydrate dehydratase [hydrothermal vent metagenome]|uniref:Nicotinamide nucleotide repair protein n=1 Tax=hydrothermal vent metagenome TaxID=652676 RepID=A0A3B0TM60_9ZZZZ
METELLTTAEMARADELTIAAGTPGFTLMEAAGRAVAEAALREFPDACRILVAAGPGNNGGDGYVAARVLAQAGRDVSVAALTPPDTLKGDAALAARGWTGPVLSLRDADPSAADLLVDALFGAGLTRAVDGEAAAFFTLADKAGIAVLAVDVPSGVDGTTGEVGGAAVRADVTVTFFRAKPGHFLLPGRGHTGRLLIEDIGIPASTLEDICPQTALNGPDLWAAAFPWPDAGSHKYHRGHTVVLSGPIHRTGASRLAARAALRIGSGLVTVASPRAAVLVNAAHLTAIMLDVCDSAGELAAILADPRHNAVCLGPGAGVGEAVREKVVSALRSPAAVVLDADALTAFEDQPGTLEDAIKARKAPVALTPHDGEFSRLFAGIDAASRLVRARAAASRSGAVIVLKGADTVIAAPDGLAVINANARPWLATAGSGDVLAGLVAGLMAQGMEAFKAAAAAVWLHGEAGRGPGLVAEDLPQALPAVLARLHQGRGSKKTRLT